MASLSLSNLLIGSVDRIRFTITKDGVAWSGIDSVTLTFEKPGRITQFARSMILDSVNVWYYDTTVTDIDTVGYWTLGVKVIDGPITKYYPDEIGFYAAEQP